MTTTHVVNFDGLVGNTHNYAGLSLGNVASSSHQGRASSPKAAALQGLEKMWALVQRGYHQGVLPPQLRPNLAYLRGLGFSGSDAEVLQQAQSEPRYLALSHSASCMWVANAATVAPSCDTRDQKVHFTPANLLSMTHRALEVTQTERALACIFSDPEHFVHHLPLVGQLHADEGAANHSRFSLSDGGAGVHFFVYGQSHFSPEPLPQRYPARQTKEASQAVARLHQLNPDRTVDALQNPEVIDQGVFHNDVISVAEGRVLFTHERAFDQQQSVYQALNQALDQQLIVVEVPEQAVSVAAAVKSYLFNSQLLPNATGMTLVAPNNCQQHPEVAAYLEGLLGSGSVINEVVFFDLQQSMSNGGGPACLRLRVPLTDEQLGALSGRVLLDQSLYDDLRHWVSAHYREQLSPQDLGSVALYQESCEALAALSQVLALPSLYPHYELSLS